MITLRPVQAADADALFPLLDHTPVTDTLVWDGPQSLQELREGLTQRARPVGRAESHAFTVIETSSARPIGGASLRPASDQQPATLGFWLGMPYHGREYGTHIVRWLAVYGFEELRLEKLEAFVFVGNEASRRVLEKNGFQVEEVRPQAVLKRGRAVDEWRLGLSRPAYLANESRLIVHLTSPSAWQEAVPTRQYRAASLDSEGFIHLSRPDQVLQVANRFYRDLPEGILLWVDPHKLEAELRWEAAGDQIFPHLYGPLPARAVLSAPYLPRTSTGTYQSVLKA